VAHPNDFSRVLGDEDRIARSGVRIEPLPALVLGVEDFGPLVGRYVEQSVGDAGDRDNVRTMSRRPDDCPPVRR